MPTDPRHFKEEIQELLDNRLDPEARLMVEKHLESCEECRKEWDALRWTKRFSHQQYAAEAVPAKLEENIIAALNLEDRRPAKSKVFFWGWQPQRRATWAAYGFLLFVAIALVLSYFILRVPSGKLPELASPPGLSTTPDTTPDTPKPDVASKPDLTTPPELPAKRRASSESRSLAKSKPAAKPKLSATPKLATRLEFPSAVARDYRNYKAEALSLVLETEDVREMEKFFSAEGIPFSTRVFDLGMMNYRLVGGRVHQLINRQSALFVYRGGDNKILVCQMYPGHVGKLPAGAVRRENKGIQFYIYRMNGLTTVFWQEGAVMCVLASDINSEEVVQLAFAKAVKI